LELEVYQLSSDEDIYNVVGMCRSKVFERLVCYGDTPALAKVLFLLRSRAGSPNDLKPMFLIVQNLVPAQGAGTCVKIQNLVFYWTITWTIFLLLPDGS
jgi:hypothetical protein